MPDVHEQNRRLRDSSRTVRWIAFGCMIAGGVLAAFSVIATQLLARARFNSAMEKLHATGLSDPKGISDALDQVASPAQLGVIGASVALGLIVVAWALFAWDAHRVRQAHLSNLNEGSQK